MFKPAASPTHWLRAALIAGAAAAAAPAFAQTVEELTVIGRQGVGPNTRSLSAVVSYRDLDLTTETGRTVLNQRVRSTAQDLCRQLGENNMGSTGAAPSCEQDALNSVGEQQRVAITNARPHNYATTSPAPAPVAPAAESQGQPASATVTNRTVTNGPVPDTPENREAFGGPNSAAGQRTTPKGN
jgi:UrcA family protein